MNGVSAGQVNRRWDRRPETERDARFFDLRESGYRGAIDQDGHPVADVDEWIHAQAPGAAVVTSGSGAA